jgi:hypothetical protein
VTAYWAMCWRAVGERTAAFYVREGDQRIVLKHARYALWKNPQNLSARELDKLAWIAKSDPRLYRAYLLKEGLRHAIRPLGVVLRVYCGSFEAGGDEGGQFGQVIVESGRGRAFGCQWVQCA